MKLKDLCRKPVVQVRAEDSVIVAAKLMREHHVGDVIVTDTRNAHEVPVGILTDRDIVVTLAARGVELDSVEVKDVMSANVLLAREDDDMYDVLQNMRDNGVRRIPVVNDENILVGMLSFDDVVIHVAREMSALSDLIHVELLDEGISRD